MSPSRKAGGRGDEEEPRPDETQEYELGEEFLDDIDDEEEVREEELADEELRKKELARDADPEEIGDEDLDEADEDEEYDDEEDELERVVSAETQEWEGLEAAEAESERDEPTLVASAAQRVRRGGSSITSGFEKVGKKTTSGFKAVGSKNWDKMDRAIAASAFRSGSGS